MRALASHQCGSGSNPARYHMWAELVLALLKEFAQEARTAVPISSGGLTLNSDRSMNQLIDDAHGRFQINYNAQQLGPQLT